jgi:GNAT superfamily N-acetyltransferase
MLDDPDSEIIERGGHIFVAVDDDHVVGVCSLVPASIGSFQLAKMAVSPEARGRGIGRLLGNAAIDRARNVGASTVELYSNTVLAPAIRLYESLGFVEVPLEGAEHVRSNIRMVLKL